MARVKEEGCVIPELPKVKFSIDFQDGFKDDTIALKIKGKEVLRIEKVSTGLIVSFAHIFETEVEPGKISVEITIPTRNLATTRIFDVLTDTHFGVSLVNGEIVFTLPSSESFGYV